MKMKLFFIHVIALALALEVSAQSDQVILNIAGDNITRSEFEKVFRKNNTKESSFTKQDVNDYLELFINYKLKVKEALEMKMDTVSSFQSELAGYRKQLAQPYLADKSVTDSLLHEAYDRMKKEVRAAHILVKCPLDAFPKDTIEAYNKAMKIRSDVMKGADFTTLAKEVSADPTAKDNGGDLGYFTALMMVYPFESAVYNTPVGHLSMPVRTRFGYHIIKVIDQRPAQGEIKVAQIHVKFAAGSNMDDSAKAVAKINEIYAKLKAGESFENLARQYSDDPTSAKNGGALPMFGTGRMVPVFEKAAFELKDIGDYSTPVRTSIGWHIIKLLERKPLGTYEELQGDIKSKVSKDSRSEISKSSMVTRIKQKYGFKEVPKAKDEFLKVVDSSLVQGKWTADKAAKLTGVMFTLGTQSYTHQDFAKYVADHQSKKTSGSPKQFALDLYNEFVNESVMAYEEARLDQNYPEFKALMQEYRDGILLFELTDQKVWSRAVKDSAGLNEFYEKNKNNYLWPKRVDAIVYTCSNEEIAKQLRKMLKKGIAPDSIARVLNKDSQLNLQTKQGKFAKGDNEIIDTLGATIVPGITPNIMHNGQVVIVDVKRVIQPEPKTLEEAKGLITSDYQNYLEKGWIAYLRNKYPVTVHQEVVDSIVN